MVNSFFTISEKAEFRIKEKGSLFIGIAFPVHNVQECDEILAQHRKEFYDATHVCYAYRVINGPVKYSDDGEPTGTAGVRLLNAIEHYNYFNILVLSIRYFGGTKLGVGPLGKAYYDSAKNISQVYRIFSLRPVKIIGSDFNPSPVFKIQVPYTEAANFENELRELLNGKFTITFDKKGMVYS
ncbi:MAG: YigZ family protein [Ignavibacteriales bacterium]|nr:YigZ family protein [Ignavibacteriales bacterium]